MRFPESGELNLNVTQSAAGWDLQVKGISTTATYLNPNQQFQAKAQVYNNSNTSDKIYKNVNYTFTLYDPSGNIQQSFPGKIDNLNQSDTKEIVEYFNAGSSNGNYQLVFTVNPTLDSNPNNNSNSFTIIVGSTGPTSQWLINPEDREVYMIRNGDSHPFNNSLYTILGISTTGKYIGLSKDGATPPDVLYEKRIKRYNSSQYVIICEVITSDHEAYVSFGKENTGYVNFTNTTISGFLEIMSSLMQL